MKFTKYTFFIFFGFSIFFILSYNIAIIDRSKIFKLSNLYVETLVHRGESASKRNNYPSSHFSISSHLYKIKVYDINQFYFFNNIRNNIKNSILSTNSVNYLESSNVMDNYISSYLSYTASSSLPTFSINFNKYIFLFSSISFFDTNKNLIDSFFLFESAFNDLAINNCESFVKSKGNIIIMNNCLAYDTISNSSNKTDFYNLYSNIVYDISIESDNSYLFSFFHYISLNVIIVILIFLTTFLLSLKKILNLLKNFK